jgi:hypothetical protein
MLSRIVPPAMVAAALVLSLSTMPANRVPVNCEALPGCPTW